MNVYLTY